MVACGRVDFDAIHDGGDGSAGSDSVGIDGSVNQPTVIKTSSGMNAGTAITSSGFAFDLAHSALFFSQSASSANAGDALVCGTLTPTGLQYERGLGGGNVAMHANIVTWDGWSVERGEAPLTVSQGTTDVAIPPVDLSHSFPVISTRVDGGAYGAHNTVRAELLDATTLRFSVRSMSANQITVCWQVITIPDAKIVRETFQMASGETQIQHDAPANYDDLSTMFAYSYAMDTATTDASLMLYGQAGDDSQVVLSRADGTGTIDISYYVVQLAHGLVDGGGVGFSNGQFDETATAGGFDVVTGVPFLLPSGATSDYLADANPGRAWATIEALGDNLDVQVKRDATVAAGQASVFWQRVQLVQ